MAQMAQQFTPQQIQQMQMQGQIPQMMPAPRPRPMPAQMMMRPPTKPPQPVIYRPVSELISVSVWIVVDVEISDGSHEGGSIGSMQIFSGARCKTYR